MYVTVEDFLKEWEREAELTQKVLERLTDESLEQKVYPEGRTLGRLAWHITTTIPEYLNHFGVETAQKENPETVPASAKEIAEAFKRTSTAAAEAIRLHWTDESLKDVQAAFGRQETNAQILMGLIKHTVHHRGQMTVLIRQAGIKPYGVYGPPKEDWVHLGVEKPPL
ncbi:hypothetical protein AC739_15290 [Planococcus glaciei]|uniref:DinB family protein n=1 Tax=Planococcus glaciei TaxID=459472 RepID=UPI00069FD562|nr:DinB family protein [Planococcus glaciei]KOF09333.1 hypothetical protein AC739_15290 [Planococcus glaciei]